MKPWFHFILSSLLSILLFPSYGWPSFLTLVGGFLIDLDHFILYYVKKKDFNIINAYSFYKNPKSALMGIPYFHNLWLLLLVATLSLFYSYALIILIGLLVHYTVDIPSYLKMRPKYQMRDVK